VGKGMHVLGYHLREKGPSSREMVHAHISHSTSVAISPLFVHWIARKEDFFCLCDINSFSEHDDLEPLSTYSTIRGDSRLEGCVLQNGVSQFPEDLL